MTHEKRWAHGELHLATHQRPPQLVPLPPPGSVATDSFEVILAGREGVVRGDEVITATRVALLAQTTANGDAWRPWQATPR